jgi:hypothetical protein
MTGWLVNDGKAQHQCASTWARVKEAKVLRVRIATPPWICRHSVVTKRRILLIHGRPDAATAAARRRLSDGQAVAAAA